MYSRPFQHYLIVCALLEVSTPTMGTAPRRTTGKTDLFLYTLKYAMANKYETRTNLFAAVGLMEHWLMSKQTRV